MQYSRGGNYWKIIPVLADSCGTGCLNKGWSVHKIWIWVRAENSRRCARNSRLEPESIYFFNVIIIFLVCVAYGVFLSFWIPQRNYVESLVFADTLRLSIIHCLKWALRCRERSTCLLRHDDIWELVQHENYPSFRIEWLRTLKFSTFILRSPVLKY